MPRLTQIKETKKGRLALFFDGEFAFSLDEQTFADVALHQDDLLEDWQIEELRKKSETRRALDKAMDYLSLRDHAAGELYQKLCRKFDAHSAAYAVARAGELGLLNDAGFARRRAAELLRKRKSRREILMICRPRASTATLPPRWWRSCLPRTMTAKAPSWKQPARWSRGSMRQSSPPVSAIRSPPRWHGAASATRSYARCYPTTSKPHRRGRACPALSPPIASPYRFAM